jgi:hypothetical protein
MLPFFSSLQNSFTIPQIISVISFSNAS